MSDRAAPTQARELVHLIVIVSLLVFAVGVLLAAWLEVWQWALTGMVVMMVLWILPAMGARKE